MKCHQTTSCSKLFSFYRDKTCPQCKKDPQKVFCCQECDSMVCNYCVPGFSECPVCGDDFIESPPLRNFLVEKMIKRTKVPA